jgi:hypothetical protein
MPAIVGAGDEGTLKRRLSGADERAASLRCEPSIPQGGSVSSQTKLRRTLALALAGGSLAIGVPAALAAGGGSEAGTSPDSGAPATRLVQDEQQPDRQDRPDRDCPEHDGGNGNGNGSGSADSGTSTPEV